MPNTPKNLKDIRSLVEVVSHLRGPHGCPWDQEQTHTSLARYAIEETHEMVEALEERESCRLANKNKTPEDFARATEKFKDELGDVLFQVVLHAQLASEEQAFTFDDIVQNISEKLIRRHPHVFGDTKVSGINDVFANWEKIKKSEKASRGESPSLISVPIGLPALQRAYTIGIKTHKIKFDWETPQEVWLKVEEEIDELKEAMDNDVMSEIEHEIGDVLFSVAQLARHFDLDPEQVLRSANSRFLGRFENMIRIYREKEKKSASANDLLETFSNLSTEEKEKFWKLCKQSDVS